MQPNTPHAVITPEPTICLGGHFYATSTIQQSIFGWYLTFLASSLTNADHLVASQEIFRRLLVLYFEYLTDRTKHNSGKYIFNSGKKKI